MKDPFLFFPEMVMGFGRKARRNRTNSEHTLIFNSKHTNTTSFMGKQR